MPWAGYRYERRRDSDFRWEGAIIAQWQSRNRDNAQDACVHAC